MADGLSVRRVGVYAGRLVAGVVGSALVVAWIGGLVAGSMFVTYQVGKLIIAG